MKGPEASALRSPPPSLPSFLPSGRRSRGGGRARPSTPELRPPPAQGGGCRRDASHGAVASRRNPRLPHVRGGIFLWQKDHGQDLDSLIHISWRAYLNPTLDANPCRAGISSHPRQNLFCADHTASVPDCRIRVMIMVIMMMLTMNIYVYGM